MGAKSMLFLSQLVIPGALLVLTALSVAFAMWSRRVEHMKQSLDDASKAIQTLVAVKLEHIETEIHSVKVSLRELAEATRKQEITVARLEERLRNHEN